MLLLLFLGHIRVIRACGPEVHFTRPAAKGFMGPESSLPTQLVQRPAAQRAVPQTRAGGPLGRPRRDNRSAQWRTQTRLAGADARCKSFSGLRAKACLQQVRMHGNRRAFMHAFDLGGALHIRDSIVVSISACHAEGPGSIPGRGIFEREGDGAHSPHAE